MALLLLDMFKSKGAILLVASAVMALLLLQAFWLYNSFCQEKKLLEANIRQSTLEALSALEQQEDLRVLVNNIGVTKERHQESSAKPENTEVRVVISKKSHEIIMNNISGPDQVTQTLSFVDLEDSVEMAKSVDELIRNADPGKVDEKVKDYEKLLRKIVIQTNGKQTNIRNRIDVNRLQHIITNKLKVRGVFLKPGLAVVNEHDSIILNTPDFVRVGSYKLPLFGKDIINQHYSLRVYGHVGFFYFLEKGGFVIAISVLITLLLIITFILLYRRMLDEQKLNQYKNDFINNLTHELKTPLATIALANVNLSAKMGQAADDGFLNYTRIISEEGARLNAHIEKVLELSQMERSDKPFKQESVNIHELINAVTATYKPALDERNGKLTLALNARCSLVKTDAFHLKNVLGNLIDNAIKYCVHIPEIEIETVDEKHYVCVLIKDNGVGIGKEDQARVFDKFYRVTENNLHPVKGFGLGLSYARQAIALMQGQISLSSEKNKGSVFTIKLPYANS